MFKNEKLNQALKMHPRGFTLVFLTFLFTLIDNRHELGDDFLKDLDVLLENEDN